MLTPLPTPQETPRNLRRERRLWHDGTRRTPSMGCAKCPDHEVCGGLQVGDALFDCLGLCCHNPTDCVYYVTLLSQRTTAAQRAGITKRIGFHTFRHSFATILRSNREDIKTAQELLRHANGKVTMDTYTQAFDPAKIAAQERLADMFVPICSRGSA